MECVCKSILVIMTVIKEIAVRNYNHIVIELNQMTGEEK